MTSLETNWQKRCPTLLNAIVARDRQFPDTAHRYFTIFSFDLKARRFSLKCKRLLLERIIHCYVLIPSVIVSITTHAWTPQINILLLESIFTNQNAINGQDYQIWNATFIDGMNNDITIVRDANG